MKRKTIEVLCVTLLLASVFATLAGAAGYTTGYGWYVKPRGNSTPDFPDEAALADENNGIYLDKAAAESGDKVIYLTFDAGYENGNVEKVLDALKAENVPGAFFILSQPVLKNTDLICRMEAEGHLVCNHTKNHADMTKLSDAEIEKNLTDLEKIYEQKTGKQLAKFFRFPEGHFDEKSIAKVASLGYTSVFWSFAYPDWDNGKQPNPQKAIERILANTHPGEIILLHPTSATNAKILPVLIREWKKAGYRFGRLDEIGK